MVSERFVRSTSLSRVTAGTGRWKCCQCGNVASSNVANGQWDGRGGPLGFAGMEARHPDEARPTAMRAGGG